MFYCTENLRELKDLVPLWAKLGMDLESQCSKSKCPWSLVISASFVSSQIAYLIYGSYTVKAYLKCFNFQKCTC